MDLLTYLRTYSAKFLSVYIYLASFLRVASTRR